MDDTPDNIDELTKHIVELCNKYGYNLNYQCCNALVLYTMALSIHKPSLLLEVSKIYKEQYKGK